MAPAAGLDENELFRVLFAAYPDALVIVDDAGTIVRANPAAARLLDYPIDDLQGRSVDDLVPVGLRRRHAADRAVYRRDPRPRPMGHDRQLVARRRDGSEVVVEIALSPLRCGVRALVVAAIRDIGTYPRVKQALRRARYSEALAQIGRMAVDARDPRSLVDAIPEAAARALEVDGALVLLLDPDRHAFHVAGSAGATGGDVAGATVANTTDTPAGYVLAERRAVTIDDFRTESRFTVPRTFLDEGLVSGLAVPLSDRGRPIGVLGVRTRSPRRFGDDEIGFLESLAMLLISSLQRAQSEEALGHAERLESVGQLTGGIAHDFNNLLTIIQGNLQVLDELPSVQDDLDARRLVDAAARATRRGAELTGKLLAFSRRQVLQPQAIDLHELLTAMAAMLGRTLDEHIEVEVEVEVDCPLALADPIQLEAALLNVAINARDAMPDGGTLRFGARACDALPDGLVEADPSPGAAHGYVALTIADTGTGMSEEVKERAFEPFFTTKEAGRGTGLGLSTVYGFVKQSRGALGLESRPGAGTTLTLFLPQPGNVRPKAQGPHASATPLRPGIRVLLVDDDADVRAVAQSFLEGLKCLVVSVGNANDALAELDGETVFDVLFTDIALGGGMRGTALAAAARRRDPVLAVVLTSGFSAELVQADVESPPDWGLLKKPYSRDELTVAIATALGR